MRSIVVKQSITFTKKRDSYHGVYWYWSDAESTPAGVPYQWLRISKVSDPTYRKRHGLKSWVKWQLHGYTHQLTQLDPQGFASLGEAKRWASRLGEISYFILDINYAIN